MEFTVKRNALLGELNLVQGVIEKKSTIPILSNILIEAGSDRVDITATDLDVSICCGCAASVSGQGTTTVSARRLFDIVRLLPEDAEISCILLENDWVELKSGNSLYKIVGLPKENFPSIPEGSGSPVTIAGNVLRSMIMRTMFAITQEESRYSLNGALLVLMPQEIRMVATDGHRLALVAKAMEVAGLDSEIRALIPRKTLIEIQKLIGDQDLIVEFSRDENHLFFGVGGKRLVSRILAGQFPNYEMVIPRDNDKTIVASTRALGDGIRRAAIMSDEKLRAIRLAIGSGVLELTASSAEAGEAREVVPVEYEGAALEIGFNPIYLLDFLGACGTDSVSISVRDPETQGMLRPGGTGDLDYRYVVMPMKF
ncbi:MAG TPA: DNA polymerase III subunit beta [Acidobacteriota bacterium]|nr:DNA polymerase III subunit beta [Acidobacteriota bacterium]